MVIRAIETFVQKNPAYRKIGSNAIELNADTELSFDNKMYQLVTKIWSHSYMAIKMVTL